MLRKVTAQQAISNFKDSCGVVIYKPSNGKLYIKLNEDEAYVSNEDGKIAFSSHENYTTFLNASDPYDYECNDKKVKLSFQYSELPNFQFYLIEDSWDEEEDDIESLIDCVIEKNSSSKTVNGPTPIVDFNIGNEPVKCARINDAEKVNVNTPININLNFSNDINQVASQKSEQKVVMPKPMPTVKNINDAFRNLLDA